MNRHDRRAAKARKGLPNAGEGLKETAKARNAARMAAERFYVVREDERTLDRYDERDDGADEWGLLCEPPCGGEAQ